MADVNTELLKEQDLRGALPDGFKTVVVDEDRLRSLEEQDLSNIENTVDDYGSFTLSERNIIQREVVKTLTSYVTPERTLELPGTGLEYAAGHIEQFASYYKRDNETPSGTIKDAIRAGPDDIVFTFAGPEVYEEISGQAQDTFEQAGLAAGNTLEVIGDNGADEAANSAGNSLQLDDDEMLFFTGDFIDLSNDQSVVSKIQWADIDGEDYGPDSGILDLRLSGAHVFTSQGGLVKSTADLDAKVYADGDAELGPVAFYMASGTKAPALV